MMKKKQIGAFLMILCMGVFAACSDNDDTPPIEPTDLAIEAQGSYKGDLNIKVPPIGEAEAIEITEINKIKLSRTDVNKIELELKDFSFGGMNVGDIVLSDLSLEKDGDKIVIKEASRDIKIMGGTVGATVAVSGTVVDKKIDLSLKITKVLNIDEIKVGFKGDKMEVDNESLATEAQGTYKGDLNIKLPASAVEIEGSENITMLSKVKLSKMNVDKIGLELKDFSLGEMNVGDIVLNDLSIEKDGSKTVIKEESKDIKIAGGYIKATVIVTGTVENKKIDLNLRIITEMFDDEIKVGFKGDKMDVDNERIEAKMTKITFDSPHVVEQPTINGTRIALIIKPDLKPEDLEAMIVTLELSDGATSTPESGKPIDLSTGSAKIMIVAEDGIHKTEYTVTTSVTDNKYLVYDMEEWVVENPKAKEERQFSSPLGGWSSSNSGVDYMKMFGTTYVSADAKCVTETTDAYLGKGAARVETLDTKGGTFGAIAIPKITSGSLFLGTFKTDFTNTLLSTKFGVPFSGEPKTFEGYYKYKAGATFYRCPDPKKSNIVEVDEKSTDEFAIQAVLYKIESDDSPYLTGVDINNSDKVVARAVVADGTEKSAYTHFEAEFEYVKGEKYDSSMKYRIAIICSSSKEGDKFSGAPGSVLYVDDLTIVSK